MDPKRHQGFAPIAGQSPRLLILGTFPGQASREKQQYYGFGRNQFWRLLYEVLEVAWQDPDYAEKTALLRERGIALWDIVESCETDGSLDTAIKNPRLVDLPGFVREHPTLRRVCFNGGNAARYAKKLGPLEIPCVTLPSTSPANARYSYAQKREAWWRAVNCWEEDEHQS